MGTHSIARIIGDKFDGAAFEDVDARWGRRLDRDAFHVAVDVAVDGDLTRPDEAPVEGGLAIGQRRSADGPPIVCRWRTPPLDH